MSRVAALVREAAALADAGPPEPRPLYRALPPPPAFPVDALLSLRPAAEAIHEATQAPLAMCGQAVLAAATLAAQAHRDVDLPGAGRRPLTGLFATIAASGERKSSVDRKALAPAYAIEEAWRAEHEAARATWHADKAGWEAAKAKAIKDNKGDRAAIRVALDQLGPEPPAPPHPMLLISDPTPEAVVKHLADVRPWGGIFTAEGGAIVGGHSFRDENRMSTAATLNALWDGDALRRARVTTGAAFLPGRRVTLHVMLQPVAATRLFGDAMLDGLGTLARFLVVAPDTTAGTRLFREPTAAARHHLEAYRDTLLRIMQRQPRTLAGTRSALDPIPMALSQKARAAWVRFHDFAEKQLADGGQLAPIRGWGAKAAEHAGRLAAALTVAEDMDAGEVSAEAMAAGIALAQHYAAEMLRLVGGAEVDPQLRAAERVLDWWRSTGEARKHLAAIYEHGPRAIRSASAAREVLAILEEHGRVKRLPPTEIDGMKRRDVWELVA